MEDDCGSSSVSPFSCDTCHSTFSRKDNLQRHKRFHTEESAIKNEDRSCDEPSSQCSFSCDVCSVVFTRRHNLIRHMKIHTGDRPFQCRVCSSTFIRKANLAEHLRSHVGRRPYKCDICESAFFRRSNLRTHVQRHTESRPFKCDLCDYASKTKCGLKVHAKRHSKGPVRVYKPRFTSSRTKLKKVISCEVCSSTFSRKDNLRRHMKIHLGLRPFECETCGTLFTQKSHLTKHTRVHTKKEEITLDEDLKEEVSTSSAMPSISSREKEEGPCSSRKESSSSPEGPSKTHAGDPPEEQPFICGTCSSVFAEEAHLVRHMFLHVKKEHLPEKDSGPRDASKVDAGVCPAKIERESEINFSEW